jgi:kynurenine formamidase
MSESENAVVADADIESWFERYSNWGRWGPDDMLGTLNLITLEKRRSAVTLVRSGMVVSCSRPVEFEPSMDVPKNFARHFMHRSGDSPESRGAEDSVLVNMHAGARTHIDSPSHVFWNGRMFNNLPSSLVSTEHGARAGAVDLAADGIVTRGVLLDIAGLRHRRWLEPGEAIFPHDLEAAERAQGVSVGSGDVLLVRTGHAERRLQEPLAYGAWPGLHAMCIPWLYERGVSVLAADSGNDVSPSGYMSVGGYPIHRIGIVAMGLWLIDNCNHERLSDVCAELGRWEFLFVTSPLNMPRVTGSLVNPLAIL